MSRKSCEGSRSGKNGISQGYSWKLNSWVGLGRRKKILVACERGDEK